MIYNEDPTPFRGCVDLTPAHGIKRPSRMAPLLARLQIHITGMGFIRSWVDAEVEFRAEADAGRIAELEVVNASLRGAISDLEQLAGIGGRS